MVAVVESGLARHDFISGMCKRRHYVVTGEGWMNMKKKETIPGTGNYMFDVR